jgi:hypothetical protein
MAGWQLDSARFAKEVFVPARAGWDVGRNLFRLFQLPLDVNDDELVEQAVRGVESHLKRSALAGVNAGVAGSLRHGFADYAATMRETSRRSAHRDQVRAERRDLAEQVRVDLRGMPALQPAELDALAARVASRFVRREVEELLAEARIAVREPVDLAVPPQPPQWSNLRLALRTLGRSGLAEYLAARGLGPRASAEDLRRTRATVDRSASGDALTAEETVLTAVGRMVAAGTLAEALRRELVEELTEAADQGPAALQRALARPEVRKRVAALGLPAVDDLAYALLCRVRPVGGADERWREEVRHAMTARDLRSALDILDVRSGLPPDLVDLRTRLRAELAEVAAQLTAAIAEERGGDTETAAVRYQTVLRTCQDPAAEEGLRRCLPPAPAVASARVEGDRVVVSWTAAPVRAGEPTYRVVRRADAGRHAGRSELTGAVGTTATTFVDTDPPAGTPLGYEVSTVRAEVASARAAVAPSVVVLRAVDGLVAEVDDAEVRLRWRLPDGALGARVRRTGGPGGADPASPVDVSAATTTAYDPTVTSGHHYTYAVEAAYDQGGTRTYAAQVTVEAHPQAPPDPVTDLTLHEQEGGTALVRWTPPLQGRVELRQVLTAPPTSGTILAADADLGEAVPAVRREAGGVRIVLPADGRRRWLVPLTVAGELGAVGAAVEHDRRLPPVVDLQAHAQGPIVRLTWVWPGRAGEARVLVRVGAPVEGPHDPAAAVHRISAAVYGQSGFRVPGQPGVAQWFAVGVTAYDDGREVYGPLTQVTLAARPTARYAIRPAGRGRRRLVVTGAAPLPAVQLRYRVTSPPLRRDEGESLLTLTPSTADDETMSAEFDLPRARPLHLRAFALDVATDLVPDHPEQLRVDRGWWR